MANPRRTSSTQNTTELPTHTQQPNPLFQSRTLNSKLSRLKLFLKKPQAFPILLSIFLFLTWVSLKIHKQQHIIIPNPTHNNNKDHEANLIRLSSTYPSTITKDPRGWMLDPVTTALKSGLKGGALICASIHVGEIKPGGLRGNHRHYFCNETFLMWGARIMFRVENRDVEKGCGQVIVEAEEVAVAVSPMGTAHALVNVDLSRTAFIVGCQDRVVGYNKSDSDFGVWDDLKS